MKRKAVYATILDLIFIIVFNIVFFVSGGSEHPTSVWISYGFIHFAYIMVLVTPFFTPKNSSAAILGAASGYISTAYFVAELVIGSIFIVLKRESYIAALLVQLVVLGVYAAILLVNLISNEQTAQDLEQHEREVEYINFAASKVKPLVEKAPDKRSERAVEKVYDLLHSSPTASSPLVRSLEEEIVRDIDSLEQCVMAGDSESIISVASAIVDLVGERNRQSRY